MGGEFIEYVARITEDVVLIEFLKREEVAEQARRLLLKKF